MTTSRFPDSPFLHRTPGEKAVPISRGSERADQAVRAVLHAPDGRVLVKRVQHRNDGTFSGEVYGVMPGQTSVRLGEVVQFEESQIFRFRASDIPEYDVPPGEMEEMARSFDAWWKQAGTGEIKDSEVLEALDAGPAFDIKLPEDAPDPTPAPVPPASRDTPRATAPERTARTPEVEKPISLGEAYSILGASNPEVKDARHDRIEPRVAAPPRVIEETKPAAEEIKAPAETPRPRVVEETKPPVAAKPEVPAVATQEPAPVPESPASADQRITCVECGACIVVPPLPPDTAAPAKRRVSCRQCGRINDVKS